MSQSPLPSAESRSAASARQYPEKPRQVYLLGTCLVDSFYPQAGMDAIELIRAQGVDVIYPQSQTCCGQPAYNSGFDDEARAVARQQLDAFREDIPVVVMMGSCAGMVHQKYPDLFAGHPEEAAVRALAARTYEFTEFMVSVLKVDFNAADNKGQTTKAALHTSCSARRGMNVAEQHKALLGGMSGVEVVEPERVTECCGFGGTFAVKQPDISAAMAEDKARYMAATEADVIVSADCGCLMNIGGTLDELSRQGECHTIPTEHIASFVRRRLDGAEGTRKTKEGGPS